MWHFQKIDPFKTLSGKKYITFIGSGGKTTFIEYIAEEFIRQGKSAAVTTTTKIMAKEPYTVFEKNIQYARIHRFLRTGKTIEGGKLTGMYPSDIMALGAMYDIVLIEADGAKKKPLKFPASFEPVIPSFSEKIFILCGLDGLSRRVDETVFRWELFDEATGIKGDEPVTSSILLSLFSEKGILKDCNLSKTTVVLNKYDASGQKGAATGIAKGVIEKTGIGQVIISSLSFKVFYSVTKS